MDKAQPAINTIAIKTLPAWPAVLPRSDVDRRGRARLLAQLELLDLARGGFGYFAKHHGARHLETGQVLLAMLHDVIGRGLRAGFQLHEGAGGFAQVRGLQLRRYGLSLWLWPSVTFHFSLPGRCRKMEICFSLDNASTRPQYSNLLNLIPIFLCLLSGLLLKLS